MVPSAEVLALPDRGALLDQVDELRAHREGLGAVRRGDRGDERDIADRRARRRGAIAATRRPEARGDLGAHVARGISARRGAPRSRARDGRAVVVVADDALEDDERAVAPASSRRLRAAARSIG